MTKEELWEFYNWYYNPGEVLRSIGFYINPYKQWNSAKFRHVFAFDGDCNLYVAQYSVYPDHIDKIFDLKDKREFGFLYPKDSGVKPIYSTEINNELGIEKPKGDLNTYFSVVNFDFLETKNITYLNRRLKKMAQRFYDYGMPSDTVIVSSQVDLWEPSIKNILQGKYWKRPERSLLEQLLDISNFPSKTS